MKADDLLRRLTAKCGWKMSETEGSGSHLIVRFNGRKTIITSHAWDMKNPTY